MRTSIQFRIYEVGGIAGDFNVALEGREPALVTVGLQIPLRYTVLEGKDMGKAAQPGSVIRPVKNCAKIKLSAPFEIMTNLKMNLTAVDEKLSTKNFYGKVINSSEDGSQLVRFTSVPAEIDAYFQAHLQIAANQDSD